MPGDLAMNLAMLGDVMLGRHVNEALAEHGLEYPWGDTLPLLRSADARLCNLECVISDDGKPWSATPKQFHFRSDARNVRTLLAGGVNIVSLANNHALDMGYDALDDTIEILNRSGIKHAGAGRSLDEAENAAILETRGIKIGMLAFTDNEPEWEATPDKPGTFYVPADLKDRRAKRLLELIRETKRTVDILIVSAHWGPNWGYAPPREHVPFASALVKAGADVVFGHSGHVFRGIEIYRNRPILYCAGNFIDDYAVDLVERNDESFIFLLQIGSNKRKRVTQIRLYPTRIRLCQANRARGVDKRLIGEKMQRLCAALKTTLKWSTDEDSIGVELAHEEQSKLGLL